jgi:hypothetical protein
LAQEVTAVPLDAAIALPDQRKAHGSDDSRSLTRYTVPVRISGP